MSSRAVEQIKERLPIAELIASYIKLDRAGANLKGKCPFHNEKSPSFFVSPERNSYYCFGCGAKGDIFTFLQEFEKVDFKEALSILADRAGVVLETYAGSDSKNEDNEKDRLRKIMESATSYFEDVLKDDAKALEYLKNRGLEDKTIKEWRIGSTKKGWNHLYDVLKSQGYSDAEVEKAGLGKQGSRGIYDRFRSRIIFPIFDPAGKTVAFTGRFKEWEADEAVGEEKGIIPAKYLNSPDTPLFDKSRILYGFNKAKLTIAKWKFALLVEGQMDLLMAQQAGYTNAVATSGTALTKHQLEMLCRFSRNLMIAYDADNAGIEAARRAWLLALSLRMDVKMVRLPKGQDPADIIKDQPDVFKDALRKSEHIVEFYLNVLLGRGLSARDLGKAVESEVLPYVKAIESPIDQRHFVSVVSAKTSIKEEVLIEALKKATATSTMAAVALPNETKNDTVSAHNIFSKHRLIAGIYLLLNEEEKAKQFVANASDIRDELLFSVEEWIGRSEQPLEAHLKDLIASLEKESLKKALDGAMKAGDFKTADEVKNKLAKFT